MYIVLYPLKMEEIQPLNILLTLFTLPKIPRWNNQMGKKSEPLLQNKDFLVPKNTVQATNENDAPQKKWLHLQ